MRNERRKTIDRQSTNRENKNKKRNTNLLGVEPGEAIRVFVKDLAADGRENLTLLVEDDERGVRLDGELLAQELARGLLLWGVNVE